MAYFSMNDAYDRQQTLKLDENGEQIIAEALCKHNQVCLNVCQATGFFCFLSLICIPCGLILGWYYGRKAADAWRLYLTPSGVHYSRKGGFCYTEEKFIPLGDIEDVFVEERIGDGASCISLKIKISRDKLAEYVSWCSRSVCLVDYLDITEALNAPDFAEAIKKQMTAGGTF